MEMDNYSELALAIRKEREAEKILEECRRRTNELAGLVSEKEQRKKSLRSGRDFNKACGL